MPKKALSLTLDESNLLWLKGRARVVGGGNLSETVDRLITEARAGRLGAPGTPRSVVGTIDLPDDDPELLKAGEVIRGLFSRSLSRPLFAHETPKSAKRRRPKTRG